MLLSYLDIDPAELEGIQQFEWLIRSIAKGFHPGKKLSKKLGVGLEFSQYRPYSQGDDLRRLDWKMYARSNRYYIKQSEIETEVEVTFVLDTSRSMLYEEDGRSKIRFAQLLTGLLGHFSLMENDTVGLVTNQIQLHGYSERAWRKFLFELDNISADQVFSPFEVSKRHGKELFVVLTDHYEENSEISDFITQLKSKLNEVLVLHLLGEKESKLAFKAGDRFEDLETNEVIAFAPTTKSEYQAKLESWKHSLRDTYLKNGIEYLPIDFTSNFSSIIQSLQNHRKNLL